MASIRIIPRLDIKGPNLVKGIHLEGLRVLGDPDAFARYYYENGADELMYQDVVASLYERNSLHEIVRKTARQLFIPLTVGGGIRTLTDIRDVLRAGADKVCLNTAAVRNPELVRAASRAFGSSTIVVAVEAIKQPGPTGRYEAFTENGREATGLEAVEWATRLAEMGAGELIITSVDREGTGLGFDGALIRAIADAVSIPVIAHGGAGCLDHVIDVCQQGHAHAVALSSLLHYEFITHPEYQPPGAGGEGNTHFLRSGRTFSKIQPTDLPTIKAALQDAGIECRPMLVETDAR